MRCLLAKGEVVTMQVDDAVESLSLIAGEIWLTRSSDTRDYCLHGATRLAVVRGETLFIEAMSQSTVTINCRERRTGVQSTMPWPRNAPRPA